MEQHIYLDNSATTAMWPGLWEELGELGRTTFANPASLHYMGLEAQRQIDQAAKSLAAMLKVDPGELIFTSGGTEANNMAILGAARAKVRQGRHILCSAIEHPSVIEAMAHLEKSGYQLEYLPVDGQGRLRLEALEAALRPDTILLSLMHTNNEIGSIQPLAQAARLLRAKSPQALFHVDAVQGFSHSVIHPRLWDADMLSLSAHKWHGPKGAGLLYLRRGVRLEPLFFGGGQQQARRPGTENLLAAQGMALAAARVQARRAEGIDRMGQLRQLLAEGLACLEDVEILGGEGAPHILAASFGGVRSEVLLHALAQQGIFVSSGSACSSRKKTASHVLAALGLSRDRLDTVLRFSFSYGNTIEEIGAVLEALRGQLPMLRRFGRR